VIPPPLLPAQCTSLPPRFLYSMRFITTIYSSYMLVWGPEAT
jgi:hypothetical protein